MNNIDIIEVKNDKQKKQFDSFPKWLYKANRFYSPLRNQSDHFAKRKMPFKAFLAISAEPLLPKHRNTVGRIAVCINENSKEASFTNMDLIDNHDVAEKLLSAAEEYARSNGMKFLRGPLSWNGRSYQGLLANGFDQPTPPPYNYSYYRNHLEDLNFERDEAFEEKQKEEKTFSDNRRCYIKKL